MNVMECGEDWGEGCGERKLEERGGDDREIY